MINFIQKEEDIIHAKVKRVHIPSACRAQVLIPTFLSKATCGVFGTSDDTVEKYQSLDELFIHDPISTYFFEADGDSMEPTIFKGQILVVDRSVNNFHRRVCVISYDGTPICKRVYQNGNSVILKSDNPKYKDIVVTESDSVRIFGVVVALAGYVR